jgi:exosortase
MARELTLLRRAAGRTAPRDEPHAAPRRIGVASAYRIYSPAELSNGLLLRAKRRNQKVEFLNEHFYGLANLSIAGYVIVTLLWMHATMMAVTLYYHRDQAHRSVDLHPVVRHLCRFWLWVNTGSSTREWVAVHRKHHAYCEKEGDPPVADDYLFVMMLSFLLFAAAGGFYFAGLGVMKTIAFPAALLMFMAPVPVWVRNGIEVFFQYASAEASYFLLSLIGTPVYREGLVFTLPGIVIRVAQECSGVRSSVVLFITSLIASHMFLRTTWKRAVLTLFVIPLAIVRNAIRIITIALLCVHVSPDMIDSAIHKRGGPLFFGLSLIPFFILLVWLKRTERGLPRRGSLGEPMK